MAELTEAHIRDSALVRELLGDPAIGRAVREKAKELFPEAGLSFTEDRIDAATAPLKAQLEELQSKIEAEKAAQAEKDAEAAEKAARSNLEAAINAAKDKYHLNADGFDKMVARMKETGNLADPDAAAAWVVQANPPVAAPRATYSGTLDNVFNPGEKDETAEWFKNGDEALDKHFHNFLSDTDRYVRETFGVN